MFDRMAELAMELAEALAPAAKITKRGESLWCVARAARLGLAMRMSPEKANLAPHDTRVQPAKLR